MGKELVSVRLEKGFVEQVDHVAEIEEEDRSEVIRNLLKVGFNVVTSGDPALIQALDDEIERLEERKQRAIARREALMNQIEANLDGGNPRG